MGNSARRRYKHAINADEVPSEYEKGETTAGSDCTHQTRQQRSDFDQKADSENETPEESLLLQDWFLTKG